MWSGGVPVEAMQLMWLVLLVVFLVLEAATASLVSIWFCAGALAALVAAFIWPAAIVPQVLVFLVVSVLALVALRPLARRLANGRRVATNADASIGKVAQVVQEILPGQVGRVKLEGLEWAAKSDSRIRVGAWCTVTGIEGVKLMVVPQAAPGTEATPG